MIELLVILKVKILIQMMQKHLKDGTLIKQLDNALNLTIKEKV